MFLPRWHWRKVRSPEHVFTVAIGSAFQDDVEFLLETAGIFSSPDGDVREERAHHGVAGILIEVVVDDVQGRHGGELLGGIVILLAYLSVGGTAFLDPKVSDLSGDGSDGALRGVHRDGLCEVNLFTRYNEVPVRR